MQKFNRHAFVNQLLVYTLVMICFSGSIGLGTVWLRNQMAQAANSIKSYEVRTADIERRLAETEAMIAAEQSPEVLIRRNKDWNLGLTPPDFRTQITYVAEDPVARLMAKRGRELLGRSEGGPLVQPVKFVLGANH
ncbi:MAG: hypothetical protein QM790_10025 [Nibricoccus sp.]